MSKLWYKKWAENWNEALPLGNGRIGAMVFANPGTDTIYLNEETLWTGSPCTENLQYDRTELERIRQLIRDKQFTKAEQAISDMMPGTTSQLYMSLGKLYLEQENFTDEGVTEYTRELSLDDAIVTADCRCTNQATYHHEYFTSLADDVMAVTVKSDHLMTVRIALDLIPEAKISYQGNTIYAEGRCPTAYHPDSAENIFELDENRESVPFSIAIRVRTDGKAVGAGRGIQVEGASCYTLIYSIATGFNGYDKQPISQGKPYQKICAEKLENALKYTFDELKSRHIAAYRAQYQRMELTIDGQDFADMPTDERICNVAKGAVDNKLTELLFRFGKYLIICTSQPGGQPANLQGIWTKDIVSPWYSNYTVNINTEMNYWAVEQMNLPECHLPLMTMLKDLSERGNHYGMGGWACAHNVDLWRYNLEATKGVCWGFWHMGGIWMARHIYEHYQYTHDKAFLQEYMGVLEGIYDFLNDWMIRDAQGHLTTCPSTSPENSFLYQGTQASAAEGSAMDLSIIADYLQNMIVLCGELDMDSTKYQKMLSELKPLAIGSDGRILEYGEEFEEAEKGHRHISHLYGVFPANTIREGTPLFAAAKKSLEVRLANGGGHTGWSNAWIANVYARFKDGEKANYHIINMFKKSIYPNLFDAHPPFQIDGNFGICAAICEMLVQSQNGDIELLPALPKAWQSGSVEGMKVRGNKTISFSWKDGKVYDYSEV